MYEMDGKCNIQGDTTTLTKFWLVSLMGQENRQLLQRRQYY